MASVSVSDRISASASRVWGVVRGFNDLPNWLPPIAASEVDGEGIGSVRILTLADGGATLTERLDAHDDAGRSYTYSIIESPLPFTGYQATIRVADDGADACTIDWSSTFEPSGAPEAEVVGLIEGLYRAGIDKVKEIVGG